MNRSSSNSDVRYLDAEIIPPGRSRSMVRPARVIDVHPAFDTPLGPGRPQVRRARGVSRRAQVWLGIALAVATVLTLFFAFRGPIVDAAPGLAAAYRTVGIPTAPASLAFSGVRLIRVYSRGAVSLNIEGTITNPTGRQLDVPQLFLDLRDREGAAIQTLALAVSPARLNPGGVAGFSTTIADPPPAMADIAVRLGDGPIHAIALD